jgi:TolA-binding protein
VSANPPRNEVDEEGNLLIEAVSLLVQRQRESESRLAEQVMQAEERAAATERLYAELEARVAGIEEQLSRLAREIEPVRGEPAANERLARLREQLEGLKSSADGRSARAATPAALAVGPSMPTADTVPIREPDPVHAGVEPRPRASLAAATRARAQAPQPAQRVSFWDVLGSNPQDRFGLVFIGVGAVAVLYAALSLLRAG